MGDNVNCKTDIGGARCEAEVALAPIYVFDLLPRTCHVSRDCLECRSMIVIMLLLVHPSLEPCLRRYIYLNDFNPDYPSDSNCPLAYNGRSFHPNRDRSTPWQRRCRSEHLSSYSRTQTQSSRTNPQKKGREQHDWSTNCTSLSFHCISLHQHHVPSHCCLTLAGVLS